MALHAEILVLVDMEQCCFPVNSEKNYLMDLN